MGDGRHHNPGPKAKLDDVQQANKSAGIKGTRSRWGIVERTLSSLIILAVLIGEPISRQQGWEYLSSDAVTAASAPTIASGGQT